MPAADASQKVWQNWKLAMLPFDEMWNIRPFKAVGAILLTIDSEESIINVRFELNSIFQSKSQRCAHFVTMYLSTSYMHFHHA